MVKVRLERVSLRNVPESSLLDFTRWEFYSHIILPHMILYMIWHFSSIFTSSSSSKIKYNNTTIFLLTEVKSTKVKEFWTEDRSKKNWKCDLRKTQHLSRKQKLQVFTLFMQEIPPICMNMQQNDYPWNYNLFYKHLGKYC